MESQVVEAQAPFEDCGGRLKLGLAQMSESQRQDRNVNRYVLMTENGWISKHGLDQNPTLWSAILKNHFHSD